MALIVKSSIDILPWTEMEKQKLIEEKEEFLSKKEKEQKNANEIETKNEIPKVKVESTKNETKNSKENAKTIGKQDKKKEVNK